MPNTFDPRRELAGLAGNLRRDRDTVEKLNSARGHRHLTQAAALIQEAAALLDEVAKAAPNVERF